MKLFASLLFLSSGAACAFSACRIKPHHRTHQRKHFFEPLWALNNGAIITESTSPDQQQQQQPIPKQRWQHPSQPEPDYSTIRMDPQFPGAVPVESQDITSCINQIGQTSPANVLLGKPKYSMCKHGYAQAFSLNPMPRTFRSGTSKKNKEVTQRFNSGLMKLTCPLLVNSIDILEDDGFMSTVNSKLGESEEWMECMNESHATHAMARQELVSNDDDNDDDNNNETMHVLQSKLGRRGAEAFLAAGVAGAIPSKTNVDVKCLHAWMADALFHPSMNNNSNSNNDQAVTEQPINNKRRHLIGEAIVKALEERGVDISGTETCHEVCSGCSQKSTPCSSNDLSVHVPYATNKRRRKRSVAVRKEDE
mmetsp:Transcript_38348/g.92490  ORF Transcript_38348/g.92490 Transcript_38348/m.92490 type:complete len:365 (+) Transcript_38348:107-1201(+)